MSHRTRRGAIEAILVLSFLSIAFAATAQEIKPSANILLPYFEIRLPDDQAAGAVDTTFGLVNASAAATEVEFVVYTNWGIPVLTFTDTLRRTEARVIDLDNWIAHGQLPDRTLNASELAELHAALTGLPSPQDHLYRGTATKEGVATGYLIVRTVRPRTEVLWGDRYSLEPMTDYFQGETLSALNDNLEAECTRHGIRFSNSGALFEGTELIIWTGRSFQPSPTPEPVGAKVQLVSSIYDDAGNHIQDCHRELIAVQVLPACHLENLPPLGWLDMQMDQPSFVMEHLHSVTAASAELHAWCLPAEMDLEGPAVRIEKFVNNLDADNRPGAQVAIGSELHFDYHVKNTGAVPLLNVSVTDSEDLTVTCPRTSLEPDDTMVCTATSTALPCAHRNIGTVTARTASGAEVTDRDPGWYTAAYDAALTFEKKVNGEDADAQPGVEVAEGAAVTFTFVVTNTGAAPLSDIRVKDNQNIQVSCPADTLEPATSMTCTAAPIVAATGQHDNTATVTARTPCRDEVTATDAAHYYVAAPKRPAIDVEKFVNGEDADAPTGPVVDIGSFVTFRYVVTNTGDVPLTDVEMEDPGFLTCTTALVAAGASFECGIGVTAVAGQHENVATVHGHWQAETLEDSDAGHYFGAEPARPAIDLEKHVNGADADLASDPLHLTTGSSVVFTYHVTNSGNVILAQVAVTDDTGPDIVCPKTQLMPGEAMTCLSTTTARSGLQTNIGTATGTAGHDESATQVTDSDPANYYGDPAPAPAIDIEKFVNGNDADTADAAYAVPVGTSLTFTYVVTNKGNVSLTSVSVSDDTGLTVTCPKTLLQPDETMTCTATETALAGLHANTGTATGTASGDPPTIVSDNDPANYQGQVAQGCTPGYWKNHTDSWAAAEVSPSQAVDSVFGSANPNFPTLGNATMLAALAFGGGPGTAGAAEILLRAGVAALLNAAHPAVNYPLTVADVVSTVNAALASNARDPMLAQAAVLDSKNNLGCPLN